MDITALSHFGGKTININNTQYLFMFRRINIINDNKFDICRYLSNIDIYLSYLENRKYLHTHIRRRKAISKQCSAILCSHWSFRMIIILKGN